MKKGDKKAVLSIGTIAKNVSEAINLVDDSLKLSHFDMRFVKPLDEKLLHVIFKNHEAIFTVEDGTIKGGFGSAILEFASENKYQNKIKIVGIPDNFITHGSVSELQHAVGLDANSLAKLFSNT